MNYYKIAFLFLIFTIQSSLIPLFSQININTDTLNVKLKELMKYDYGQNNGLLEYIDFAVVLSHQENQLRTKLEEKFITLLHSEASLACKKYVCRKLSEMGSKKSVSSLATFLNHIDLSHMARFALEHIPDPSVDEVLLQALVKTSGMLKVGIIYSLGSRKNAAATRQLIGFLTESDVEVVKATIEVLGILGNREAANALLKLRTTNNGTIRQKVVQAELEIAERLVAAGSLTEAYKIYNYYFERGEQNFIRLAGFKGILASNLEDSKVQLASALKGDNEKMRGLAATQIAELPDSGDIEFFVELLEELPNEGQIVLISAFSIREEMSALTSLRKLLGSGNIQVRLACLTALGKLGNEADILTLAKIAASRNNQESACATNTMIRLKGDNINSYICSKLKNVKPEIRAQLINVLILRNAPTAINDIIPFLSDSQKNVRLVSLEAVGALGKPENIPDLIKLMNSAANSEEKQGAEASLKTLCSKYKEKCTDYILEGYGKGDQSLKVKLLNLFHLLGNEKALAVLRIESKSEIWEIRDAAIRSMANWPTAEVIPDLIEIVKSSSAESHKVLAFRGAIRLIQKQETSDIEKCRILREAMFLAERPEEKKLVLAAFGDMSSMEALKRVECYIYQDDIVDEACATLIRIISKLDKKNKIDLVLTSAQILNRVKSQDIKNETMALISELALSPEELFGKPKTFASGKKILFIAGPMDHAGPGFHEYPKDLLLLKKCLESSPNIKGINIEFYIGDEPALEKIENAAALVVHSSADRARGEVHGLFPNFEESYSKKNQEYYKNLNSLVKDGLGVVMLHYALWTDKAESREYMLNWVGGFHDKETSKVKIDQYQVKFVSPDFEIFNGVYPWNLTEEYYFIQHLERENNRFIPLLSATYSPDFPDDVIAWAVNPDKGGRGFAFTGCHTHNHLFNEDYRKFVLNAIIWVAGIKVPKEGVISNVPQGWE